MATAQPLKHVFARRLFWRDYAPASRPSLVPAVGAMCWILSGLGQRLLGVALFLTGAAMLLTFWLILLGLPLALLGIALATSPRAR